MNLAPILKRNGTKATLVLTEVQSSISGIETKSETFVPINLALLSKGSKIEDLQFEFKHVGYTDYIGAFTLESRVIAKGVSYNIVGYQQLLDKQITLIGYKLFAQ